MSAPSASTSSATSAPQILIEIGRTPNHLAIKSDAQIRDLLIQFIRSSPSCLREGYWRNLPSNLAQVVKYVRGEILRDEADEGTVGESAFHLLDSKHRPLENVTIYIYQVSNEPEEIVELDADGEDESPASGGVALALPHVTLDGLWENLFYDHTVKDRVLDYASAALHFARCGVSSDIVSCNRLILLHGPPGTGKTTLCKAIAHKLCIRMSETFKRGKFMEINSHSLFSKWFSESGKLVQKLFATVREDLDNDPDLLYCILIDEVESIAASRDAASGDPQDAIRAGNAVLTQLDQLKQYPNVLVMCTSNLTQMIDSAFCDRVDLKQYIGPPNLEARYEIIRSQVESSLSPPSSSLNNHSGPSKPSSSRQSTSAIRNDLDVHLPLPSYRMLQRWKTNSNLIPPNYGVVQMHVTKQIEAIAMGCESCGGRILRRAPVLCYSHYLTSLRGRQPDLTLSLFLQLLPQTIHQQIGEATQLKQSVPIPALENSAAPAASSNAIPDATSSNAMSE